MCFGVLILFPTCSGLKLGFLGVYGIWLLVTVVWVLWPPDRGAWCWYKTEILLKSLFGVDFLAMVTFSEILVICVLVMFGCGWFGFLVLSGFDFGVLLF